MHLIYIIITVFAIAAIGGLYLLSLILRGKTVPSKVALLHGSLGAIGIALLIFYNFKHMSELGVVISIFAVAALAGATMGHREYTGRPVPKWLAIVHGLLAVTAFVFLLIFAFNI